MKKLFVGKLSYNTTEADLLSLFDQYGPVKSAKVIKEHGTSQSRGFGFVELENNDKASEAIRALDGQEFGGRVISVSEARENDRSSSGPRGPQRGEFNRDRSSSMRGYSGGRY